MRTLSRTEQKSDNKCHYLPLSAIFDHFLPLSARMCKTPFAEVVYLHRDLPEAFSVRFSFDVR